MSKGIKSVYGTVWAGADSKEKTQEFLRLLQQHHVDRLDTASQYVDISLECYRFDELKLMVCDRKIPRKG